MNRTLIGIGLAFTLVAFLGVALIVYLALGFGDGGNESIAAEHLSAPGNIAVSQGLQIEARNQTDAFYLLGYAQGRQYPWTLNLLRQTALGRLGEWFGESVLPIDRLARSLAFGPGAKSALDAMPEEDRSLLESYARGVSDAFQTRTVTMDEQLVLFKVAPEPWKAWHCIALERMFAWISGPPQRPARSDTAYAAMEALEEADNALRDWLHLHGFDHSSAWAYTDSAGTRVEAQYVYGATALPLMVPTSLSWQGAHVSGVSLLGTPFLPFSTGPGGVNVTLLSSPREVRNRFAAGYPDSVAVNHRYERIVLSSGEEQLLSVPFLDDRIFFAEGSFASDSIVAPYWGSLKWAGTAPLSDWPAWHQRMLESAGLTTKSNLPFRLIEGNGLFMNPAGQSTIRGRPLIADRGADGSVYLADHPLGRYAARRFRERVATHETDSLWTDATSTWAESNLRELLQVLHPDSSYSSSVREAIDYLRNWDFRYNLASIGATIFDAWMGTFTGYADPYPVIVIPRDSLEHAQTVDALETALVNTVDSLTSVAGSDLARWRLETFRKGERFYPVWSYVPLTGSLPAVNLLRYAPLSIQGPGHPTAIEWESGLYDYPDISPSHILARAGTDDLSAFEFRPDYRIGKGIIARHVVSVARERRFPSPSNEVTARLTFLPRR